jgi:hypothetical protein
MNKRNLQRLNMMQFLTSFASINQTTVELVAAFKNGFVSLQTVIDQIQAMLGTQQGSVTGSGSEKEQCKINLAIATYSNSNVARGYFLSVGKTYEAQQLNFALSAIKRISDKTIVARSKNYRDIVNAEIANLLPWGIKPENITAWNLAIEKYENIQLFPEQKIKDQQAKTRQVYALIEDGIAICKNTLDTSANSFIEMGYGEFFKQYKEARFIGGSNTQHTKLRILATDELNQPIYDVNVLQNNTTNSINTGITGEATLYLIPKSGKQPVYTFTVSKGGEQIAIGPFQISKGETLSKTIVLANNAFKIPAHKTAPSTKVAVEK